jgi:hypothetical protein
LTLYEFDCFASQQLPLSFSPGKVCPLIYFATLFHLMSFRTFLLDIVYESVDRILDAAVRADHLRRQVIENRQLLSFPPHSDSNRLNDSQMDVDVVEDDNVESNSFFGESARALQPLLKRNRRRHEIHTQKSSSIASLIQVKAIRQKLNGACGFYSLYHSSMVRIY